MLKLENVDFFVNKNILLKQVSLNLGAGEVIHLVGANGSGKSTLIEGILNLSNSHRGIMTRNFLGDDYGYLPQVAHQFPKIHLKFQDICQQEFSFYSKDLFAKDWHRSSGGERKKALIAKAMSEAKKLLVLDEPFNHLDKETCKWVASEMEKLITSGVSIIYTGHEYELADSKKYEVSKWRF